MRNNKVGWKKDEVQADLEVEQRSKVKGVMKSAVEQPGLSASRGRELWWGKEG